MRPNENVRYMTRKRWNKLVVASLADGTMWKHVIKGNQEILVKADDDKCYVIMLATILSDETVKVEYI